MIDIDLIIDVAGYDKVLHFSPGPAQCGKIKDGVTFEHNNEGGWVISFDDFLLMVKLAKIARGLE